MTNATTPTHATPTYDQVWEKANLALHEGRWGDARSYLDDLNTYHRAHGVDELPTLSDVRRSSGRMCPETYAPVVRDRISMWNAHVRRNWGI